MDDTELAAKIGELSSQITEAVKVMDEAKSEDTARWQKANDERKELGTQIQALIEEKDKRDRDAETAKARADLEALLSGVRATSKAAALGQQFGPRNNEHPLESRFIAAIAMANSRDAERQIAGKAILTELGSYYQTPEEAGSSGVAGKATLGTTDATGGYIIPNNIVLDLMKPKTAENLYTRLATVVRGVRGSGVDQPLRNAAPARAVVASWGSTKENVNLGYDNYTATLYTIARIYDVSNQLLRQSEGAAQADVVQELGRSFALGEAYYILNGSGSSEPYGLLTALTSTGTYVSSHTAANTTVAGSLGTAIAKANKDLALRSRRAEAVVMNAGDYWTAMSQGTDNAGFFYTPSGGPSSFSSVANDQPQVFAWGLPLYPDVNMPADSLVVGEWSALKIFFGQGYRVDSSDQAGTRWDSNLTGFRGEEEIGLDARPSVYTGAFQRITDAVA